MDQISGHQIVLRDWRVADLDRLAWWLQPGHHWQDLDGPYYAKTTIEEIPDLIGRRRLAIETGDLPTPRTNVAIADRSDDTLVGMVSWYWQSEETWWLSIGIVVYDPAHWGRGIGYEALGLWCDYLWAALPQIVRLDLRTWSGNAGMMRLAHKLGFREEARFRKARIVHGNYFDGLGYGVLRDEWTQRYPDGFAAQFADIPN